MFTLNRLRQRFCSIIQGHYHRYVKNDVILKRQGTLIFANRYEIWLELDLHH